MSRRGAVLLAHAVAIVALGGAAGQVVVLARSGHIASWGLGDLLYNLVTIAVGWFLASRRPSLSLGWIMLAIAAFGTLQAPAALLGAQLAATSPSAATWLLWYGGPNEQWSWIPPIGLVLTQVPLRFPDGRLPSPRWRWFSRGTVAVLVLVTALGTTKGATVGYGLPNPTFLRWGLADTLAPVGFALLFVAFIGSVASLFVRYRRADALEGAQLRWVFWAMAVVVGLLVVDFTEAAIVGDDTSGGVAGTVATVGQIVTVAAYFLFPIAILVAVSRHGLYAIDRIVSRTAAYAVVTLVVVGTYALVVLLVSLLIPGTRHGPPAIVVALATLAAAAVFLPALRTVRRIVDRRFDRARYDAERVVHAFGERVRTGADPQAATGDLLVAVERTLQPATVGIWVAPDRS